jgi:PBP1b-binding outer membrane lipoprotein LpoB
MMKKTTIQQRWIETSVLVTFLAISVAGCSSTPEPVAELSAANTALVSAESKDATQYAPVAMDRARQKLKRAEQAMIKENYVEAKRLAEEAQADADLAQALADKAQVQAAVRELEDSIKILRDEIKRARGY